RSQRETPDAKLPPRRQPRKMVLVTCPACGTRFKTPGHKSETPCLNCDEPVPVRLRKQKPAEDEREDEEAAPRRLDVFGAMAEERFGGEVHRPTFPFAEGTFTFPWYPEGLFRWLMLSVGCGFSVLLFIAMQWCFSMGGWFARAGYAFGFPF